MSVNLYRRKSTIILVSTTTVGRPANERPQRACNTPYVLHYRVLTFLCNVSPAQKSFFFFFFFMTTKKRFVRKTLLVSKSRNSKTFVLTTRCSTKVYCLRCETRFSSPPPTPRGRLSSAVISRRPLRAAYCYLFTNPVLFVSISKSDIADAPRARCGPR